MARVNNPVLGFVACQACGGEATLHQMQRSKAGQNGLTGKYLYSRCPACGPDQRTGAAVQQYLWSNARWDKARWPEGMADVLPPPGVDPAGGDGGTGSPAEPAQVAEPAEPAKTRGGWVGGFFLALTVVAGVVGMGTLR